MLELSLKWGSVHEAGKIARKTVRGHSQFATAIRGLPAKRRLPLLTLLARRRYAQRFANRPFKFLIVKKSYEHFNFDPSPADPYQLFLIMKDLKKIV